MSILEKLRLIPRAVSFVFQLWLTSDPDYYRGIRWESGKGDSGEPWACGTGTDGYARYSRCREDGVFYIDTQGVVVALPVGMRFRSSDVVCGLARSVRILQAGSIERVSEPLLTVETSGGTLRYYIGNTAPVMVAPTLSYKLSAIPSALRMGLRIAIRAAYS